MKKLGSAFILLAFLTFTPLQTYAAASVPVTPSGIPVAELEAKTDQIMKKYIGKDVPGASVSIVKDGEIVFMKGYGYSDIEKQTPVHAGTTYLEAGSVSKLFTWTAVMQLVEQGKLDLEADIRKYLPDGFLDLAFKEPVTLNHLMSHTAGFEERTEGLLVSDPAQIKPLKEHIAPGNQPKQIYAPGTVIAYSNYGTNLAGYIVERMSGKSFEDYIQQNIFAPLDMKQSFFTPRYDLIPEIVENKAVGYAKAGAEWAAQPNFYINDMPAGSLNITAENMAHFMLAHLNSTGSAKYKLFQQPETLQQMHEVSYTHHPSLPGNAHGFWEHFAGQYRVLEHGGNTMAFSSLLSIVPEENFGISILTNAASEMSGARRELIELFVGDSRLAQEATGEFNHSGQVAGKYRSARAVDSNILKVTSVVQDTDTVITANSKGGIDLSIPYMNINVSYVEIEPYLYERVTPGNTLMDNAGINISSVYFQTDDSGKVTQLSYGVIADERPVSFTETVIFSYVLVGGAALLFTVGLAVGIIGWIRNSRRTTRPRNKHRLPLRAGVILISFLGLLSIGNLILSVNRLSSDPFQSMANFKLNILFFWLLAIAFIPAVYLVARKWKAKGNTLIMKLFTAVLMISFVAIAFFLYSYNFYSLA
ncbi:serine hydrolase [Paenibacillus albidus]|uniref:serine hydrolase domain-containing protein n=1 Tax=Paenibacillus albidus TaxID=2041023 RepID=UPI001BEA0BF0|nr:serine hydrolase domain-containing protein [Paenibacillus albidus]MBT2291699.1 serine hydrolase [Paenibacillus albidus]